MTTVLDSSVVVDALVGNSAGADQARSRLAAIAVLQTPAILLAEVASALRGMTLAGYLTPGRARVALDQAGRLRMMAYPFRPFIDRVWELRANLTVYDAWFVALAERISATLVTADRRLASAVGPQCPIELVGDSTAG